MSQGVVTAYLVYLVTKQVDDHALVVWYDPEGRSPPVHLKLRSGSECSASVSAHDCRASRADLQWSGSSRILAPVSRRQVPGTILAAIRQDALT